MSTFEGICHIPHRIGNKLPDTIYIWAPLNLVDACNHPTQSCRYYSLSNPRGPHKFNLEKAVFNNFTALSSPGNAWIVLTFPIT